MDLMTDPISGRLAETKVWSNIGKGLMCWALWHEAVQGQLTEMLLMWFAIAVLGHESVTRYMNAKREASQQPATGTMETTSSQTSTRVTP